MNPYKAHTKHAIEHQEELIKMFAKESDKKLKDRLNIIHLQSVICEKDEDDVTGYFLEIMRRIVLEAIFYKEDFNIAEEQSEIEKEMAEMDAAYERLKHRKEVLNKFNKQAIQEPTEPEPESKTDNSVQLGLF